METMSNSIKLSICTLMKAPLKPYPEISLPERFSISYKRKTITMKSPKHKSNKIYNSNNDYNISKKRKLDLLGKLIWSEAIK